MNELSQRLAAKAKERIELRLSWNGINPQDVLAVCEDYVRLRHELAACQKVILDAMTLLAFNSGPSRADIEQLNDILDSAPVPSDETLRIIEAGEVGKK